MAKQSGLHQIKGKVGEFSYYKQSGVIGGLIRSINDGMSARVKTGDEYANTRLNNVEFGGACNVAGVLGKMVVPKIRPMILPFSQSTMAKKILYLARQSDAAWGQRCVPADSSAQLASILSAQSKRDPFEFVTVGITKGTGNDYTISASYTAEQATLMASLGINYIHISAVVFNLATGKYSNVSGKMITSEILGKTTVSGLMEESVDAGTEGSNTEDATIAPFTPPSQLFNGQQIAVFTILPARTVHNVNHILQEYCSFYAVSLPA